MHQGWQALTTLSAEGDGLRVTKIYGTTTHWSEAEAHEHADAMRSYHSWLDRNRISCAPSVLSVEKGPEGQNYLVVLQQSYLGPDGAVLLTTASTPSAVHELFESLLRIAVRLGYEQVAPSLRAEVKPQDFCYLNGHLVLVDTCPPVFARSPSGIRCAERSDTDSCVAPRERSEVLRVTGSGNGIVTNLVEHCAAILPTHREDFVERAIGTCERIGDPSVAERLRSATSAQKIALLQSRACSES